MYHMHACGKSGGVENCTGTIYALWINQNLEFQHKMSVIFFKRAHVTNLTE